MVEKKRQWWCRTHAMEQPHPMQRRIRRATENEPGSCYKNRAISDSIRDRNGNLALHRWLVLDDRSLYFGKDRFLGLLTIDGLEFPLLGIIFDQR